MNFKGSLALTRSRCQTAASPAPLTVQEPPPAMAPPGCSLFHVTHGKAASQWMRAILKTLFGPAVIEPEYESSHLWARPIELERVYACCTIGKAEFDCLHIPGEARCFVLIRDLRDTLVSAYYSFRYTHEIRPGRLSYYRWLLPRLSPEEAMLFLMENWLGVIASIQRSWLLAGAPCFKMEQCIHNAPEMLAQMFSVGWGLELDPAAIEAAAAKHSFAALSGGRAPGQENLASHYRKGVAGDWRNHFTPQIAARFEQLYGDVLLLAGHEPQPGWSQNCSDLTPAVSPC